MKRAFTAVMLSLFLNLPLGAQDAGADYPACVHLDKAELHFPGSREAEDLLNSKIKAHLDNPSREVRIWHVGGSHVQAGYFSGRMRQNFSSLTSESAGDIGFIFPYPAAKTNYDHSYSIRCDGEWKGNRSSKPEKDIPSPQWGITGIAASTGDSNASVTFSLGDGWPVSSLRLMGYGSRSEVTPYISVERDTLEFVRDSLIRGYYIDLPQAMDSVRIGFRLAEGDEFTITGLQPMSGRRGISYYSSGVNGARISTWLDKCPLLWQEFELVNPDLAILGLGINDSACSSADFKPERFKENYRKLISHIHQCSPDCALIFITNNDSYRYARRRMVHNDNGEAVRTAMYELAEEYGAAVWDLFEIMGGNKSVGAWKDAELVKADRLHFTEQGYNMLGDLLFKAIMDDCNRTDE